jgi:hypothetical protein
MSTMRIDLTNLLSKLRRTHGIITVAVLSKADCDFVLANPGVHGKLTFDVFSDGRATISSLSGPNPIEEYLRNRRVHAESWIVLHEFDDHYDEATYVGDASGQYVRVQTGMLDDLFGYVAAQSRSLADVDDALESAQLPSVTDFDATYERLVDSPARVG